MELRWLRIDGFRRFSSRTTLYTAGKLVAIVGPNESGKSSTLDALERLNNDGAFAPSDISGNIEIDADHVIVEAAFLLNDDERSSLPLMVQPTWLTVRKRVTGQRTWHLRPDPAEGSASRRICFQQLDAQTGVKPIRDVIDNNSAGFAALGSDEATLDKESIAALKRMLVDLANQELFSRDILTALQWQVNFEASGDIGHALKSCIPQFRKFTDSDRALTSRCSLSAFVDSKQPSPPAFSNMFNATGLDPNKLYEAIRGDAIPRRQQYLESASANLTELVQKWWKQGTPEVSLSAAKNGDLYISIRGKGGAYVSLDGRSDGLRRFLALLCFLQAGPTFTSVMPVILLDEAESHLHYDAQAELVEVLSTQSRSPKVIYTTHSMGCLPNDIGGSVRRIRSEGDRSEFINNVWTQPSGPADSRSVGFEPLLYAMGATRLAFVPMRSAVIVEGVSDMILLPAMMLEVMEEEWDAIPFQVVGGLSQLSDKELRLIGQQGRGVICLVDSDDGGRSHEKRLEEAGVQPDRIFRLPVPDGHSYATLEDFVDKDCFVAAVNRYIASFGPADKSIDASHVADEKRSSSVDEWCASNNVETIAKRHIAADIIDQLLQREVVSIVSITLRPILRSLVESIDAKFQEMRLGVASSAQDSNVRD